MTGLEQALLDLTAAFNTMAAANGFPPVDLTPLPPATANKPGLYLAFAEEQRSKPPDNYWAQPVDALAVFDLYMYIAIAADGTPLVQSLVQKIAVIEATVQQLALGVIPPAKHFRCFVSKVVTMYDWTTRAWAGAQIQITIDSYRHSDDG
jgi:hypothetical protein